MAKGVTNQDSLERGARARVAIHDYLASQRKSQNVQQIMAGLAPAINELGLSQSGMYYHLKAMAEGGHVHMTGTPKRRFYSALSGDFVGPRQPPPKDKEIVKAAHERAAKAARPFPPMPAEALLPDPLPVVQRPAPTDVELVVGGVTVVVGRNPATGRLRITIEG